ncbi:MAG TPA: Uma2 family endonuclease [Gemmatimonadaceae bacterium]|nr:Uma2 family endonuclease [Gemmatimonadaceae bacterium]
MPVATEQKVWTLAELHSLPDDGNKYELIHGELFVTPPPVPEHEDVAARLTRLIDPFVAANDLGFVYHPRSVVRYRKSEVEPDLIVRKPWTGRRRKWEDAPIPILVVEILSPYTRRRDHEQKREFYMEVGVEEYWIADPEAHSILVVRQDEEDRLERETLTWSPSSAQSSLTIRLSDVFES